MYSQVKDRTALLVFLLLLVTLSVYAGGQQGEEISKPQKITWMVWGGSEKMQQMADIVLSHRPDLKERMEMELVVGGDSDTDIYQKLRLSIAAKSGIPDITMFNYAGIPEFAEQGLLMDIGGAIKPIENNIPRGLLNMASYKGQYIGIPSEMKNKLWFYRDDMFANAGLDPEAVDTVDQFIAAGEKLQSIHKNTYIMNYGKQVIHYDLMTMINGYGGRFHDKSGNYIVNTDSGVMQAFKSIKKMMYSQVVIDVADWTPDWEKALADGVISSQLLASWFKRFLPRYAPDQAGSWSVTLWPEEIRNGSESGGVVWCIPKDAANKELALEFLSAMRFDDEISIDIFKELNLLPGTLSAMNMPIVSSPDAYFGSTLPEAENKAYKISSVFPYSPSFSLELPIMQQHFDEYSSGQATLEEALNHAQRDLETQIGNALRKY